MTTTNKAVDPQIATTTAAIKKKVSMLPAISEHSADLIYFIGNILLVITAITAALGAIGVFWGDRVRDYYNDLRLSDNEKQIEFAKAEAARANERTALLEKDASASKASQQRVEIELAQAQTELIETKALAARTDQRTAWRTITEQQKQEITKLLMAAPRGPINMQCMEVDAEAMRYEAEIADILRGLGYPVTISNSISILSLDKTAPVGLIFAVSSFMPVAPHFLTVVNAFHSSGIPMTWVDHANWPAGILHIVVGAKP